MIRCEVNQPCEECADFPFLQVKAAIGKFAAKLPFPAHRQFIRCAANGGNARNQIFVQAAEKVRREPILTVAARPTNWCFLHKADTKMDDWPKAAVQFQYDKAVEFHACRLRHTRSRRLSRRYRDCLPMPDRWPLLQATERGARSASMNTLGETVIKFRVLDLSEQPNWWLLIQNEKAQVCLGYPDKDVNDCGFVDTVIELAARVGVNGEVLSVEFGRTFIEHARNHSAQSNTPSLRFAWPRSTSTRCRHPTILGHRAADEPCAKGSNFTVCAIEP